MALRLSALSLLQMKLEYTQLHNDFIAFFEEKLEKVIASCGSSVREFYQLLRAADRKNSSGADARFTQDGGNLAHAWIMRIICPSVQARSSSRFSTLEHSEK